MSPALTVIRYAVFALVAVAAVLAFAAMAVQRRLLSPFGGPARAIRDLSDPFLKPIERRILRAGGNPQSAPWWLIGVALILGIVLISGLEWLVGQYFVFASAAQGGPRVLLFVVVNAAFSLLMISLMIRVIGSWFGVTQYTRWMRPFHFLTEWMLGPLRRALPPFGPLDLSPLIAWLLLILLRPMVLRLL